MIKDIEKWLERNCPKEIENDGVSYRSKKKIWKKGAIAMYDFLQNNPPSKEFLDKIWSIVWTWESLDKKVSLTDYAQEHWNDGTKNA